MVLLESASSLPINLTLIITSIILFLCYYSKDKYTFWSRRGIPSVNLAKCILQILHHTFGQKTFMEIFKDHYQELEGHKYGGSFLLTQPLLILRDPAIIKEALVKGSSHFHDRSPARDEKDDQLSGNLFQLTGKRWRLVRRKLSPAFSPAKIKIMYEALKECAQELDTYLQKSCSETGETELDIKKLMTNYTMEGIGACALGIKCNSIQDPNCALKVIAESMFKLDLRRTVFVLLELMHPRLPRWLKIKAVNPFIEKFLLSVCREVRELKIKNKFSNRTDFLQILMNYQSSEMEKTNELTEAQPEKVDSSKNIEASIFTENVIASVIGSFLSTGFEPISSTLAFCFYELALNPEVQDKLWDEIQTKKKEVGDDIGYEDLNKFQYTEQVVKETLRMYPVAGVIRRNCTEPFTIPDSSFVVEKNVRLYIPVYSLHREPKYFAEPNKFDPDRFSQENINEIVPGSYLPFGLGPRSCIGTRLANLDVKIMLIKMVSNYTIHPCAKTQQRMVFDASVFTQCPKGGIWLRLQKRK